jgi:tRNA A-37 threonylcarbamoyl transferase component Bud32
MAELPINLKIRNSLNPEELESVECRSLLRVVPGKRQIFDGQWNGRAVIVKIFSKKLFAHRRLKREWQGLNLLRRCRLNAPEPLLFGQTTDRRWAVITDKIADSFTALEVFNSAESDQGRFRVLVLVCRELAKQNNKGVFQKDLHLGNFLISKDTVYALDPARIKFSHQPLCRKKSICELALLSCYLPDDDIELFDKLCREYFDVRDWRFDRTQKALVLKNRGRHRKKQIRKGLKKCMRTSKRALKIKTSRHFAVFDRDFIESAKPVDFINQIDSLMDTGRILKRGNTCYVSAVCFNNLRIVIKRYNNKGFFHSVRHTIKGSRACRCWLYGHRLGMLNIPTPRPLAFIVQKKGGLIWQSYIVTDYVEGQKLYDFLKSNQPEQQKFLLINEQLKILMKKLSKYRITHGDLKHTNILVTKDDVVLTDLDSLKFHRFGFCYRIRQSKDIKRLRQSGQTDVFLSSNDFD